MVPRSMCKDDEEYLRMLRDHFAAKAMQALIDQGHFDAELLSMLAYEKADAMLAERSKS